MLEIVEDHLGDTYRAAYTVRFAGWIYVLQCLQKKSKRGIKAPREDLELDSRTADRGSTGLRSMATCARR